MERPSTSIDILAAYRRYLRTFVTWTAVALVVVLGFSFIMPQTYVATVSVMPPDTKGGGGIASVLASTALPLSLGGENKSGLVFAEILRSKALARGVIDTLQLRNRSEFAGMSEEEIVEFIEDQRIVDVRKSGLVTTTLSWRTSWFPSGDDADTARALVARTANACLWVLDDINRENSVAHARSTREYIERVIDQTLGDIDSLQDKRLAFQRENKVLALDEQMQAIVESAITIGTDLSKAELERSLLSLELQPDAPELRLVDKKIQSLRALYDRVQKGGITENDEFSIPLNKAPELMRTYANLFRDLKIKEQMHAFLQTQRMQEIINEAKDSPTIVPLDTAVAPEDRESPSRKNMAILTVLLAAILYGLIVPVVVTRSRPRTPQV